MVATARLRPGSLSDSLTATEGTEQYANIGSGVLDR
jgi:hypothetical protein